MFHDFQITPAALSLLSDAKSRSISAENPRGEPNAGALATEGTGAKCARSLGRGWKVSPSYAVQPGETFEMALIEGSGAIQSMWMAGYVGRDVVIRMYWDGQAQPSVECPLSDFFAAAWTTNDAGIFDANFMQLNSAMIAVNPNRGMNCFWPMPFRKSARITLENRSEVVRVIYYQVNYALTDVPEEAAYFHAQFRASTPLAQGEDHVILDGVSGRGHYVGTEMHVGLNGTGSWWGEGEVKFFMDGDEKYPTICGTGTEDYFCGSYDFEDPVHHDRYLAFTTPYTGFHPILPNTLYKSQMRFGMYRWHLTDPIRFDSRLRVTIQALGWREGGRYLPLQDDIASVAFWYQTLPTAPFPALPDKDYLEVI